MWKHLNLSNQDQKLQNEYQDLRRSDWNKDRPKVLCYEDDTILDQTLYGTKTFSNNLLKCLECIETRTTKRGRTPSKL